MFLPVGNHVIIIFRRILQDTYLQIIKGVIWGQGRGSKSQKAMLYSLLADYVQWKYSEEEIVKLQDQCTYELDFDDEDKVYKQILTWLMLERKGSTDRKDISRRICRKVCK